MQNATATAQEGMPHGTMGASSHPEQAWRVASPDFPFAEPGCPVLDLDTLLAAHRSLLARIKLCYGTGNDVFERDVMAPVRRFAAFVHLLPATPANYFHEPGGLLRLGLETAFFALQGTDAHIFSGLETISARRRLEPRWRLATFIGALCADIHRTIPRTAITDNNGGAWPCYVQGLYPWLIERGAERYHVRWMLQAPEVPGAALFLLPQILPTPLLHYLAEGNTVIVAHLLATLANMPLPAGETNMIDKLVRRSAALVIDRDLRTTADRNGMVLSGSHLERYLLHALRRLLGTNPSWTPNTARARVWFGQDGLFIVWPQGAADMIAQLDADELPGMPSAPDAVLAVLLNAGVLAKNADGATFWGISPPGSKNVLQAVRIAVPDLLLAGLGIPREPLPEALVANIGASQHPETPPKPEPSPPVSAPSTSSPPLPPEPHQLELPVSPTSELPLLAAAPLARPEVDTGGTARAAHSPPASKLALEAPLRLTPRLRTALASILEALQDPHATPMARIVERGVFIALAELEHHHLEPSLCLRALADARMLASEDSRNPTTSTHWIDGQPQLGLTIARAFISGW